jgi:hypothetical protein
MQCKHKELQEELQEIYGKQPVPSSGQASAGRRRLTGRDQTSNSLKGPTWADGNHSTSIQGSITLQKRYDNKLDSAWMTGRECGSKSAELFITQIRKPFKVYKPEVQPHLEFAVSDGAHGLKQSQVFLRSCRKEL